MIVTVTTHTPNVEIEIPGPVGSQGPAGPAGPQGPQGDAGGSGVGAVHWDIPQGLTAPQQAQARTNISAVGEGDLVFNVKDYGAVGDGTTNDTTAVQATIGAANTAGGGEVFFPAGTYNLQTALTLFNKVALTGIRGRSTLLIGGTQTSGIAVVSRTSPSIINLIVDGNASTTINQLVFVSGGSGLTVTGCRFTNVATANAFGILLSTAAADVRIADNEFSAMQRGVGMTTACARVTIRDNRFFSLGGYGTYGVSSAGSVLADILIRGNHFSAIGVAGTVGRQPVYFTGGAVGVFADRVRIVDNVIIGNSLHYNGGTGNGDMIAAYNLSDSEIADNTVLYGGDVGIAVWRSRRTTVTGNVTGRNNTNGICLMESFNCVVTGNVVWSNRADYGAEFPAGATGVKGGIRALLSSTGNTITGNRCFNEAATPTQDYGLVFEVGSDNNVAIGNLLEGNAVSAVSDLAIGNQVGDRLVTRSGSYALTTADDTVSFNAASATATLPTAVGVVGRRYVIKNLHSTALTVATTSGQTIDGAAPTPLVQWDALTVMSTGTNWIKLANTSATGSGNAVLYDPQTLTAVQQAQARTNINAASKDSLRVNVKDKGALGDGTTDDRAAIQAALDAAGPGGSVYFPPGIYLLAGATMAGDRILVTYPDQTLSGDGRYRSVLKVADNHADYRAVIATAGEGAVTGRWAFHGMGIDFNARGGNPMNVPSSSTYPRQGIRLANPSTTASEGTAILVFDAGFFDFDNLNVTYVAAEVVDITACHFLDCGTGVTAVGAHDHSSIYATGTVDGATVSILGNTFHGVRSSGAARTAIETHGGSQSVTGNTIADYTIGMNITGIARVVTDGVVVTNNTMSRVMVGVQTWSQFLGALTSGTTLRNVNISHNTITIDRDAWYGMTGIIAYANGVLINSSDTNITEGLKITRNQITYLPTTLQPAADYNSSGIRINRTASATNALYRVEISDNVILDPIASGIFITCWVYGLIVARNIVVNPCQNSAAQIASNMIPTLYRSLMLLQGQFYDALFDSNKMIDRRTPHYAEYCILATSSVTVATSCVARNNTSRFEDGATVARPSFYPSSGNLLASSFFVEEVQDTYAATTLWTKAGSKFTDASNGRVWTQSASPAGATWILEARGTGTPEGSLVAPVGSRYTRTDGGAGTTSYVKEIGTGNTGWVPYGNVLWVDVVNPATDVRPVVPHVMWVGGTTKPVNMATGDLWVKA